MKHDPPTGPPLLVCDAGKQGPAAKLSCAVALLCMAAPFGVVGIGGLFVSKHLAAWVLAVGMIGSCLLCLALAVRVIRYGHMTRVELYEDRILVYATRPTPLQLHFADVREIAWDARDRDVRVILYGTFFNGRDIKGEHFGDEAEAVAFVERANEALRAYRLLSAKAKAPS